MFRKSLAEMSKDVTDDEGARAIGKNTQGQKLNKVKREKEDGSQWQLWHLFA